MAESAILQNQSCGLFRTLERPHLHCPVVSDVTGDFFSRFSLQPVKVLAEGMFGQIVLAIPLYNTNARRVVKKFCMLKPNRAKSKRHFETEVMIMQAFDHPYIIKCLNAGESPQYLAFTMYHYQRGTLDHYVGRLSTQLSELCVTQIACALRYLHRYNVVHLDVKLNNIFMDNDCNAILADFGLAMELFPGHRLLRSIQCGFTPAYVAPERRGPEYADCLDPYKLDSFCLGVVLWSLVVKMIPAVNIDYYLDMTRRQDLPVGIRCWLMNLLERNPIKRLTVTTMLNVIEQNSAFRYVIDRC